jgi:hypothetical protein
MSMKIRSVAAALALLGACLLALLVGCASGAHPSAAPSSASSRGASGDRAACASLYARLQQVTAALDDSSQLIATSQGEQQLSERIANEQSLLQQAADLMARGPIPASLTAADHDLVAALRAFTADFARAREPAARGDFQSAAAAMTDQPVVQRIVDASKKIEDACK